MCCNDRWRYGYGWLHAQQWLLGQMTLYTCIRTQDQNVCVIHVPKLDFSYSQSPDFKRLCPNPDVHPDDDLHFRRGVVQHFREVFHLCFCAAEDLGCSAIKVPGMSISYFSRKFTLVCNISQWMCLQTFVCEYCAFPPSPSTIRSTIHLKFELEINMQAHREFVENAFIQQLLAARDRHPRVALMPCFPYRQRFVNEKSLKFLDLFHNLHTAKNVCVVSPINFSSMIGCGKIKSVISRQMANKTSCLLHNSIMNPHLLVPSTYKCYPMVRFDLDTSRSRN